MISVCACAVCGEKVWPRYRPCLFFPCGRKHAMTMNILGRHAMPESYLKFKASTAVGVSARKLSSAEGLSLAALDCCCVECIHGKALTDFLAFPHEPRPSSANRRRTHNRGRSCCDPSFLYPVGRFTRICVRSCRGNFLGPTLWRKALYFKHRIWPCVCCRKSSATVVP